MVKENYRGYEIRVSEYSDNDGVFFEGIAMSDHGVFCETENEFFQTTTKCVAALKGMVDEYIKERTDKRGEMTK